MTTTFQRPENALKRAEELISVGQQMEALNVLHSTISHRKLRAQGWDHSTELIMMRHIRLCVDLEKLKIVREGLHSYRFLTQQQNILALARAMKELRDLSEAKLEAVKSKISADQAAAEIANVDVDDLEADETPESLLLSTLQVEVRDKSAEELHTALLGCWESYKIIMDLLRYAPKIHDLYHETAQKALLFCRDNKRHQEFRRLCETLRTHAQNFQKQRGRPDFDSFLRPEAHLPTRLTQLGVAADLCLWSQCFQTAEDILALGLHELLQKSLNDKDSALYKHHRTLLQQTAIFYEKLAMIFRVSEQPVFHASAVLRNLFHTRQHKKTVSKEEQIRLCDLGTLAVLCVPVTDQSSQTAADLEYQRKLASILGHGGIPTRPSMKAVIEAQGIVASASPAVQAIYSLVEGEVDPLTVCSEALRSIEMIQASPLLESYIPSLKRVIFDKLILKLSKIYTSLSISFFTTSLCPESFIPWGEAEIIIVQLVHQGVVQLHLDYSRRAILFGSISSSPDSILRNRLVQIARVLSDLVPQMKLPGRKDRTTAMRDAFYADFPAKLEAEAIRLKNRNTAVAERRKKREADEQAKEVARRTKEKEKQRKEEHEEQVRREAALKHQEELRRREEQEQLKLEISRQIVEEFKSLAEKTNGKIVIKGKAIDEITPEDIMKHAYEYEDYERAQEELRNRERQEKGRQRRLETKRVEHLVRALREEEAPLLEAWKEETRIVDEAFLAEVQAQEDEEKKQKWNEAQELRQSLIDIKPYKDEWFDIQIKQREALWEKQKKERLMRIKRLHLEEEQRLREAEERIQAEEAERKRLEAEKRAAEEKEREEALRRTAEKQRQRELEIEKKQQEQKQRTEEEFQRAASSARPTSNWRPEPEIVRSAKPRTAVPATTASIRSADPRMHPVEPADDISSWRKAPARTESARTEPVRTEAVRAEPVQPARTPAPQSAGDRYVLRRHAENQARAPQREMTRGPDRGSDRGGDVEFSRDQMMSRERMQSRTVQHETRQRPTPAEQPRNPSGANCNPGPGVEDDGFTTVGRKVRGAK